MVDKQVIAVEKQIHADPTDLKRANEEAVHVEERADVKKE